MMFAGEKPAPSEVRNEAEGLEGSEGDPDNGGNSTKPEVPTKQGTGKKPKRGNRKERFVEEPAEEEVAAALEKLGNEDIAALVDEKERAQLSYALDARSTASDEGRVRAIDRVHMFELAVEAMGMVDQGLLEKWWDNLTTREQDSLQVLPFRVNRHWIRHVEGALRFVRDLESGKKKPRNTNAKNGERKGPPPDEIARKRKKSAIDKEIRDRMKGRPGSAKKGL